MTAAVVGTIVVVAGTTVVAAGRSAAGSWSQQLEQCSCWSAGTTAGKSAELGRTIVAAGRLERRPGMIAVVAGS